MDQATRAARSRGTSVTGIANPVAAAIAAIGGAASRQHPHTTCREDGIGPSGRCDRARAYRRPRQPVEQRRPARVVTKVGEADVERGLPPAFRVADVSGLAPIHAELTGRGYQAQQPTLVQVGTVQQMRAVCSGLPARVSTHPEPAWSSVYLAEGFDPVDGAHRVQALSRSPNVVYACVEENGQSVAAGTAAFSQGWCSIHGMRTLPAQRSRGLATRVLAGLADAATDRALERVFLQVEEGNAVALALYRRAGFTTAWRYHYWRHT